MKYCDRKGRLDLACEHRKLRGKKRSMPWFEVPGRASRKLCILFGHWAALGLRVRKRTICLDSGCVWGGRLTALRLEDRQLFQVPGKFRQVRSA